MTHLFFPPDRNQRKPVFVGPTRPSLAVLLIFLTASVTMADDPVDFTQNIRPILATHCLTCHGPDEESREGGLRLDRFESATGEADSGEIAVVPGKPEQSELIRRITLAADDSDRMPPTGKGLDEKEIALLKRWIAQGARFDQHWSFIPPRRHALPQVNNRSWTRNGIDRFVLAKLEAQDLSPSPEADRYVLARRVYLDLAGVPPTTEEADRFVNDPSPDAYERMVDRVLGSPRYGERWARVWLDLARYADSQGYAQDSPRTIYRFRDWVIEAINSNKPFDEFTIEQIAGDMLDSPTTDQIIATAFHRNTMTNSEGGTDNEEFRVAAVVDRVNTTMEIWMGMTMTCARCHSHKYDPISQQEYFQVFSLLNQTEDADRNNEAPLFSEISRERSRQIEQLKSQIESLEKKIRNANKPASVFSPPQGKLMTRYVRIQGIGKMFLHLAEVQTFVGGENVAVRGKASQSSTAFGGPASRANDGNTNGDFQGRSVTHTAEQDGPWWEVDLGAEQNLSRVVVWNRNDSEAVRNRLKSFRVILYDRNRRPIWIGKSSKIPDPSHEFLPPSNGKNLTPTDRKELERFVQETGIGISPQQKQLADLRKRLAQISRPDITTPIMKQLPPDKQRTTRIHIRGNFRNPGDTVGPGTPKVFHPLEVRGKQPDRLDFARWLVSGANPISARVTVNRYWEHLFGTGIVRTSEDFGTQGELPSHPELLDYLAVEFMEHDWDVKWLLREIVCSATYRQSSKTSDRLNKLDPDNRLFTRGPRMRLPAEMIRDQALSVSGTLSTKMNGPSVRPPKPKLGLRAAFGGTTDWDPSPGEDSYRRGLYTFWRRTAPYPSMTTFDAPSREFCTIRRSRTNTPLQALVTLNDPVFVDAARALASTTISRTSNDNERLTFAFRRVLIRPPQPEESRFLLDILHQARSRFTPESALEFSGRFAKNAENPVDLAAWTVICNVLLNLDETLARP